MKAVRMLSGALLLWGAIVPGFPWVNSARADTAPPDSDHGLLPLTVDLGVAREFNGFFLETFESQESHVQGRLVAGGHVSIDHVEIAQGLNAANPRATLIVGGDLTFPEGRVHQGDIVVGGSADALGESVIAQLADDQTVSEFAELPFDLDSEFDRIRRTSRLLAELAPNGLVEWQSSQLVLTGDCESPAQVFALDAQQAITAQAVELTCIPAGATVILNIDGDQTGFVEASFSGFELHRQRLLFNFHQAEHITLTDVSVQGSILAPLAHIESPQGMISGTVMARSWNGSTRLNQAPFKGVGAGDFCAMYPIALPFDLIETAAPGSNFKEVPRGTGPGSFSWLTWAGNPNAPVLANSLIAPGDSYSYVNPDDNSDWRLSLEDWVQAAPGAMNSKAIRDHLDALLGTEIVVPAWSEIRERGNNLDYQVAEFARVRLLDYHLPGNGWFSFEFLGFTHCYNRAPEAFDQHLETEVNTPLDIELTGEDPDGDELIFLIVRAPENGALAGQPPFIQYIPDTDFVGTDSFDFVVGDGYLESTPATVTVEVVRSNLPPEIISEPRTIAVIDEHYEYPVEAIDPDGDVLTYSLTGLHPTLKIGSADGLVEGLTADGTWAESVADPNRYCTSFSRSVSELEIDLRWQWQSQHSDVTNNVFGPPMVARIIDINGDGVIDERDPPTIVFVAGTSGGGYLVAINGDTGEELWISRERKVSNLGSVAVGDLTGDGRLEIVVVGMRNRAELVAFNSDGSVLWIAPTGPVQSINQGAARDWISIADLNGDGSAEVIHGNRVFDEHGELLWVGQHEASGYPNYGVGSIVADLDQDGYQEVLAGRVIYGHDGQVRARNTSLPALGFNGVADFTGDGHPEIVYVAQGRLYLLDQNLEVLWGPKTLPGGGSGGPPTIADFTGDGYREIGVAGRSRYLTYDRFGNLLWSRVTQDFSSHRTGSSVFDFEGDGRASVLYGDEVNFYIYDGPTGIARSIDIAGSGTTYEYPLVVDATGDGAANILLPTNRGGGVRLYQSADLAWMPTRSIWNQHAYHVDNINDDGTVPASPRPSWQTHNTYRLNSFSDGQAFGLPDLSIKGLEINLGQTGYRLSATIENRGLADYQEAVTVEFYAVEIYEDYRMLGSVVVDPLRRGKNQVVVLDGLSAEDLDDMLIGAVIRPNPDILECNQDNHWTAAWTVTVKAADPGGLYDQQRYLLRLQQPNRAPIITSSPVRQIESGQLYQYSIVASDPDRGDQLRYSLVNSPRGMWINSVTGEIFWRSGEEHVGVQSVTVAVHDLADASDTQSFDIEVTPNSTITEPPYFVSEPLTKATVNNEYRYLSRAVSPDELAIEYALVVKPAGMEIDPLSGEILWAPSHQQSGSHFVVVRARDESLQFDLQEFILQVSGSNQPPVFLSEPVLEVNQGDQYVYHAFAEDPDGDSVSYHLWKGPVGMEVDDSTGRVTWDTSSAFPTSYPVELVAHDGFGGFGSQEFKITVTDGDGPYLPPEITSSPPLAVDLGSTWHYQVEVTASATYDIELILAPAGAVMDESGLAEWTPDSSQLGAHDFVVEVRDEWGSWAQQSFSVYVNDPAANNPPQILSTPPLAGVVGSVYQYHVEATDPDGDVLEFVLATGPAGASMGSEDGLLTWTPTESQLGLNLFEIHVLDGNGGLAWQRFEVHVGPIPGINQPPNITSLPPLAVNLGEVWTYQVEAFDPDGDPIEYQLVESATGASMDESGLAEWAPDSGQLGVHEFVVEVHDNRGGWAHQSFAVHVNDLAANNPPEIVSIPPQTAIVGLVYSYQVEAVDPDGDVLEYVLASGPAGASMQAQGLLEWIPLSSQIGPNEFEIHVLDGRGGIAWQRFTVLVEESSTGNHPPIIHSTPPLTGKNGFDYVYNIVATDPEGDELTFTLAESPEGMTLNMATGELAWLPEAEGLYPVTIKVSDAEFTVWQSWQLEVLNGSIPLDLELEITPTVADIGQTVEIRLIPEAAAGQVIGEVMVNDTVVSVDPDLVARYVPSEPGEHQVVAAIDDGFEQADAEGSFFVRDPGDDDGPFVSLSTPDYEAEITAPTMVIGTVQDDDLANWVLAWAEAGTQNWTLLAEGTEPITEVEIAEFDPTLLINGQYRIGLQAWDNQGRSNFDSREIQVTGDMKLGHFSITFEDATVPLAGIPITLTRTYDTRQRHKDLDFGFGWSVGYQDVRLHESRRIGLGWTLHEYRQGFFSTWCMEPNGDPIVTVRLPDDEVHRFRAKADPECQFPTPFNMVQVVFEPLPGTNSSLVQTDYTTVRLIDGNLAELEQPDEPIDPDRYQLTLEDGTVLTIHQHFGLRQLQDTSDNTLTFTRDGITHSSGVGIDFIRDGADRITQVVLPDGELLDYLHDAQGNLTAFADQLENVTQFTYLAGADHYLEDIIDPRGVRAIRNEYDEDGRLIAQIDADGNRLEFDRDIEGRAETIRDRRGNATVYIYDERGNVLSETNALGETTLRTYDRFGNELTRTDPLGQVWEMAYDGRGNQTAETDPLGQTNHYTYNDRSLVTRHTAPDGTVVMDNQYSTRTGNLIATADALGHTSSFIYDFVTGNLVRATDPLGQDTQYFYTVRGDLSLQIDPSGVETAYTHDAMGRVLTETVTWTDEDGVEHHRSTSHVYDAAGNRIQTTDALGAVRQFEYDEAGQMSAEIDPLGRRTEYEYDHRGNQVRIIYPDGSSETSVYDPEGNLIAETDRAGRTTKMIYDAAGRLIETILPDATPADDSDNPRRYSIYDAAGRLVEEVDERGHSTFYQYDAAGRNTKVIDALGNETVYEYDSRGQRTAMIDARGHRTEYVYDAAGRLIRTRHPNGTESTVDYDALGQKFAQTDPAGRTTRFEYDPNGQLIGVIDALGQRTEYGYDGQGNRIAQTDANGHTTTWSFDIGGRVISRTLPMGQTETFVYDIAGQRVGKTDFNGQIVEFTYDAQSRPIETVYPDDSRVETRYTPSGQVWEIEVSCSPASCTVEGKEVGITVHQYDERDRLTRIQYPDSRWIEYSYDEAGNRTEVRTQNQRTRYTFDALNRMSTVTACANESCTQGDTTTYSYNAVGSRSTVEHANGTATEYQYDSLNRLTLLTTWDAFGAIIHRQQFHLGAAGHREMLVEDTARVVEYSYDPLYRLTEEKVTDPRGDRVTSYTFDPVGNRLSRTTSCDPECFGEVEAGTTTYIYDANDRLLEEAGPDGVTIYAYDANGNTLSRTAPDGTVDYHYNADDRLIRATGDLESGAAETAYTYDAHGIRQRQTADGITARYLVDPTHQYAQVLEELDGAGNPTATYVIGQERISQTRTGTTHTYHADGLGSIRVLTDDTGTTTDTYVYEAYGNLEHSEGDTPNTFRYTGEQYDPNLGFYYLRARYYDPSTGRFPTMDTYQGRIHEPQTLHKYLYVHGDPVNGIDPSGNLQISSFGMAINLMGSSLGRTVLVGAARPYLVRVAKAAAFAGVGTAAYIMTKRLREDRRAPPTFLVGSNHPEVREHIRDAQLDMGIKPIVNLIRPAHSRSWLRGSLTRGVCGPGLTGGATGKDCDEFPMAAHRQGGRANYLGGRVSVKAVSLSQNRSVGQLVGQFHATCNIEANEPGFKSAYVMGTTASATHFICGVNR